MSDFTENGIANFFFGCICGYAVACAFEFGVGLAFFLIIVIASVIGFIYFPVD